MGDQSCIPGREEGVAGILRLVRIAGKLKSLPRTGWVDRGVELTGVESVADHSFRVALLAWLAASGDPTLNRDRVLLLALVHDLAEAIAGDRTPYDLDANTAVDPEARRTFLERRHAPDPDRTEAKRRAEAAAMVTMTTSLAPALREEILAAWAELEAKATPEARFVKEADKLETYLQSREYAERFPGLPVASFAAEVAEVITHPALVALRDERGEDEPTPIR